MRLLLFSLLIVFITLPAQAADKQWYVAVHGENFQLITGASGSSDIKDGKFLQPEFVGKEIYVRSQEHYELDQFRPKKSDGGSAGGATAVSGAAVAKSAPAEPKLMTEFGPLTDTGLQYALNGDFHGWGCSHLYIKPLGNKTYRLRCDTEMKHW